MCAMKQMTLKQAQKWLEKLKSQNPTSYKQVVRSLRKYQKTDDQYDCYVKMNQLLLLHTKMTLQINQFMEEQNKFILNKPEEEKIKDFMNYVKKNKPDIFDQIIKMIEVLSQSGQAATDISNILKPKLRTIVKGDPQLQRVTQQALDITGEQLIKRKKLDYLRVSLNKQKNQEHEVYSKPQKINITTKLKNEDKDQYSKHPSFFPRLPKPTTNIAPFTNPSQERTFLRQLEKSLDQKTYNYIIKLIKLYYLTIITKSQIFQLLSGIQIDDILMDSLKEIIETRQTDRRKSSVFRPLNDVNFNDYDRASPSYVTIPYYYPIRGSGRTSQVKAILNQLWVSVPHGSQQNFNIRHKNINEDNLLKAEDARYEFDLYKKKASKVLEFLQKILDQNKPLNQQQRTLMINKIINMGVIQILYKTSNYNQKQQIQWMLKINTIQTCKIFRDRLITQINQLKNIRQIHAIKNWSEIATKNYYKALDLKGFQFKKNQKQRMKGSYFLNQLQEKCILRDNGGVMKNLQPTFDDKKEFFSIFNSFSSISRTQKCQSRILPEIQRFDLKQSSKRHLYPLLIIAFQNQQICKQVYSLILFYLDNTQMGDSDRNKCKAFLQQLFQGFLSWNKPVNRSLKQYDQQKFNSKLNGNLIDNIDFKSWIKQQFENSSHDNIEDMDQQPKKSKQMNILKDQSSKYSYLPAKSQQQLVFYGSQHIYSLCRFVYTLYQRIIKMKQVADVPQKIDLFYILVYSCIKYKQSNKFQQGLNSLFGKHSYLFSTIYKLLQSLVKSILSSVNCPFTSYSFKNMNGQSQQLYFVLINRFCLNNSLTNNKLLRLTYNIKSKVMYFNYLDCYYKSQEIGKDISKKRLDISKAIQVYTVSQLGIFQKKKRKLDFAQYNGMEYMFQGNTIKMLNQPFNQDILYHQPGRKFNLHKILKRQIKRGTKLLQKME